MATVLPGILVGVLVAIAGGIFNFVVTARRDKRSRDHELEVQHRLWRREDFTRYHETRRLAYLRFLRSIDLMPMIVMHAHADDPERKEWQEWWGKPEDIRRESAESFAEIEMFGSERVVKIANELQESSGRRMLLGLLEYIDFDEEGKTRPAEKDLEGYRRTAEILNPHQEEVERLKRAFIEAVRDELRVDVQDVDSSYSSSQRY